MVITDIKMPRMDGLEMASHIVEEHPAIRVVFLTSYADFSYAQQAVRLKAADYLLKPVDEGELQKLLEKLSKADEPEQAQQAEASGGAGLVDWQECLNHEGLNIYVRQVLERIEADYRGHLGIEALAGEMQISPSYLSRKLKEATGHTFSSLLARYRLQEAIKLLQDGRYKVYEVAEHTGFGEYKNFSQTFKKYFQVSPKQFMQAREFKM